MSGARNEPQQMAVRLAEELEAASEKPNSKAPVGPVPHEGGENPGQVKEEDKVESAAAKAEDQIDSGGG